MDLITFLSTLQPNQIVFIFGVMLWLLSALYVPFFAIRTIRRQRELAAHPGLAMDLHTYGYQVSRMSVGSYLTVQLINLSQEDNSEEITVTLEVAELDPDWMVWRRRWRRLARSRGHRLYAGERSEITAPISLDEFLLREYPSNVSRLESIPDWSQRTVDSPELTLRVGLVYRPTDSKDQLLSDSKVFKIQPAETQSAWGRPVPSWKIRIAG